MSTEPPYPTNEAWIRFMAPVNPQTAASLLRVIDSKLQTGLKKLHLMISSPGGSVFHGLSIYNFLKGAPIEVITYNFGSVDSIGVVIFCSGDRRISVPNARFLIHGVSMTFNNQQRLDEKDMEEKLKGLRIDYQNIARVISDTTGKDVDSIINDMETRITLTPQEAKDYGLVQKIAPKLFPFGADLSVIHEDASIGLATPRAVQQQFNMPVQHSTEEATSCITIPLTDNITSIDNSEQAAPRNGA